MPTFDFSCTTCKKIFEATIPFQSKKYPACPFCGAQKVDKLISMPSGIVFKGKGFYKTDSAKKPANGEKTAKKPPETTTQNVPKNDPPAPGKEGSS